MPTAVKEAPGASSAGGEPEEGTAQATSVTAGGAGGDLQVEEGGLTATASEMVRVRNKIRIGFYDDFD